jgi:ubiquinone/menaquinone biosynthesis C-methylase UbiE
MRTAEIQGRLWGTKARDWADYGEGTSNNLFNSVLQKIKDRSTGKNLLDAGCGAGGFCKMASDSGFKISGLDGSDALISIARERVPAGDFYVGDIEELPFPDNTFDVVTGFNSFQFAGDIVNAFREAARAAKKYAPIFVSYWGSPEACDASAVFAALAPYMPTPQKASNKKPLYTDGVMESYAAEAGLYPESTETIECIWEFENEDVALQAMLSAGIMNLAIQNAGEEKVRELTSGALKQFQQPGGSYFLKNTFLCTVSANNKNDEI